MTAQLNQNINQQQMKYGYHKAVIVNCNNEDLWYADSIGKIFYVKEISVYADQLRIKRGGYVHRDDICFVRKTF